MFVAVYHRLNLSNLYISEEEGISYSLSLDNVLFDDPAISNHRYNKYVLEYNSNVHAYTHASCAHTHTHTHTHTCAHKPKINSNAFLLMHCVLILFVMITNSHTYVT